MADPDPLDEYFAAVRATPEPVTDAVLERIKADAVRELPSPALKPAPRSVGILGLLGGWPALGGLATATMAGVWIGMADPLGFDPLGLVGAGGLSSADLTVGYADLEWGEE